MFDRFVLKVLSAGTSQNTSKLTSCGFDKGGSHRSKMAEQYGPMNPNPILPLILTRGTFLLHSSILIRTIVWLKRIKLDDDFLC